MGATEATYRFLNPGEVRVTRLESQYGNLSVELEDDDPYSRTNTRIRILVPPEQQAQYAVGTIHAFSLTPVVEPQ